VIDQPIDGRINVAGLILMGRILVMDITPADPQLVDA